MLFRQFCYLFLSSLLFNKGGHVFARSPLLNAPLMQAIYHEATISDCQLLKIQIDFE